MLQAFIVVFREGFESFLIVGVILAYLRRIGQHRLIPAMYWGVAASILASTGLGYMLNKGVNESLWEGIFGVVTISWAWVNVGHLINVRRFFQVTAIFLLLFMVQIGIYSFHEFSEAGVLPNSEMLHDATEPFSPTGIYGRWFSLVAIGACGV